MPAPYTIVPTPDGLFDLLDNIGPGAPAPTDDETRLARAIKGRVYWARNNPAASRPLFPAWADGLRQLAADSVASSGPRSTMPAMIARFQQQFGDLDAEPVAGGQANGAFRVRLDADREIRITKLDQGIAASDAQRAFASDLAQRERLVRALYRRGAGDAAAQATKLDKAVQRMLWAARIALEGTKPDVALARLAMDGIVADAISDNGLPVRGAYLTQLGRSYAAAALAAAGGALALYLGYAVFARDATAARAVFIPPIMLLLLTVALWSLCAGAWLSAAFRVQPDSPEVLSGIFSETLGGAVRAAYVVGFGFLAILLLHKQVIVFAFGASASGASGGTGFTTQYVLQTLSGAVLTGGLLGLGEAALPNSVVQRSANLIAALGSK